MTEQQLIVATLRREFDAALKRHLEARAERVRVIARADLWDELHPDGVGRNPFDLNYYDKEVVAAMSHYHLVRAAYDYAVDTFLGQSTPQ